MMPQEGSVELNGLPLSPTDTLITSLKHKTFEKAHFTMSDKDLFNLSTNKALIRYITTT